MTLQPRTTKMRELENLWLMSLQELDKARWELVGMNPRMGKVYFYKKKESETLREVVNTRWRNWRYFDDTSA